MKNWILYSVIGLFGCLGFAQELTPNEPKKWTLEACITHAIENNISVKQATIDVEAVDIDRKAALGRFWPSVNANANSSWNIGLSDDPTTGGLGENLNTVSGGLNASVNLYNGLQNQKRLQQVKLSKIAAEFHRTQIQENTAVMIANAFLQIISNKENVKIQKEQLANNELRLQRTQELVDGGQLPKGEALNIQADIFSNKQQLIFAETELYLSQINLAQILVLENPMEFEIDDSTIAVEPSNILVQKPQDIVAKALNERVEVKLAQSRVNVARKDMDIAKSGRAPSLSAFYDFRTGYSNRDLYLQGVLIEPAAPFLDQLWNNRGNSVGLSLRVPIFNGFQVKTGIERAQVAFEKAKLTADQARLDLENDVYTAYAATERALNSYLAAQETVKARAEAFRYTQERNAVGMSNSYDVSQSQVLLTTAQSEMNKAKYDYLFRVKILELYFGVKLF